MRPLLASRWSQLRRPVVSSTVAPSHRIRAFHSTRPRPIFAESIYVSTGFLHGVHSFSHLPWVASIPLAALIIRVLLASPLMLFQRRHARRQGDIAPLIFCHRKHIELLIKAQNERGKVYMRPQEAEIALRRVLRKKTNALHQEWGVKKWAAYAPVMQFPIWLILMEGIRNMSGVNLGLFRYFIPLPDSDGGNATVLPGPEQSFASEAGLNLLAGDPTGIFPIVLGLSIIANVRSGWKTKTLAEASDLSDRAMSQALFWKTVKEGLTGFGVYIAFTAWTTGMPIGMMLYWIASTNFATIQAKILDRYMFASKPLKTLTPMHVRILRPGEKPPPVKPLLP